ncbi:HNH endonuclease [Methylorubrum extorquens]|uniref:HNH endonuclease n=1 Tax=Methylorubrum extorquens TaxID=408 RepID=UPI003CC730C3
MGGLGRSDPRGCWSCGYCGTNKGTIVLDHIIPKAGGGLDAAENLTPACEPCNQRKGAQLGWVTLDGRVGTYDPKTGPLPLLKRKRRGTDRPRDPFRDHAGIDFL